MFGTACSHWEVNTAWACPGTYSAHLSNSLGQSMGRNIILLHCSWQLQLSCLLWWVPLPFSQGTNKLLVLPCENEDHLGVVLEGTQKSWNVGMQRSGSLSPKLAGLLLSSQLPIPQKKMTALVGMGCSIQLLSACCGVWLNAAERGLLCWPIGSARKGLWVSCGFVLPGNLLWKESRAAIFSVSRTLYSRYSGWLITLWFGRVSTEVPVWE